MREILLNSAILATGSACFTVFLDFCMRSGNIFGFWGDFVNRDHVNDLDSWFLKPLGACLYCFGAWVFIVFYLVTIHFVPHFIGLFAGLGFNHIILTLLNKVEY